MGGELASLVAAMLEQQPWVGELHGFDLDPPRRRLRRSHFHLLHPLDHDRMASIVRDVDPHVILHLGVYEPGARADDGSPTD